MERSVGILIGIASDLQLNFGRCLIRLEYQVPLFILQGLYCLSEDVLTSSILDLHNICHQTAY